MHEQQLFNWNDPPSSAPLVRTTEAHTDPVSTPPAPPIEQAHLPDFESIPFAPPLAAAIEAGVFGMMVDGENVLDEEQVQAITIEHAAEMTSLLAELLQVEDALRTGEDPRTGRIPKNTDAATRLREYLEREEPRLKSSYGDLLAVYVGGFGEEAGRRLDLWVRKAVADCTIAPNSRYDPGHPWHYYHEGDNAPPIPLEDIEPSSDSGRFLADKLPKNRVKRIQTMKELLMNERERVKEDKRRYQEIVERGAEALSRYDREIAHTSDEMARATALSLKYNHICWGMGRVAWLEKQLGIGSGEILLSSDRGCVKSEP